MLESPARFGPSQKNTYTGFVSAFGNTSPIVSGGDFANRHAIKSFLCLLYVALLAVL